MRIWQAAVLVERGVGGRGQGDGNKQEIISICRAREKLAADMSTNCSERDAYISSYISRCHIPTKKNIYICAVF